MAFVAVLPDGYVQWYFVLLTLRSEAGVVRVSIDVDTNTAEFALSVRSDLKQRGIGTVEFELNFLMCRH